MKFWEYILIIATIGMVFLPFILRIVNKKKGKPSCSSGCCCCPQRGNCSKMLAKKESKK